MRIYTVSHECCGHLDVLKVFTKREDAEKCMAFYRVNGSYSDPSYEIEEFEVDTWEATELCSGVRKNGSLSAGSLCVRFRNPSHGPKSLSRNSKSQSRSFPQSSTNGTHTA